MMIILNILIMMRLNYINYLIRKNYKEIFFNGDHEFTSPKIKKLPNNMLVNGDLKLNLPNLEFLPENLFVDGFLNLYAPKVSVIPDDLTANVLEAIKTNIPSSAKTENISEILTSDNCKATFDIDLVDSDDWLRIGRDLHKSIFDDIFGDDFHGWYNHYENDISGVLDYYTSKENDKRIEELIEKYASNVSVDEDFNDMSLAEKIDYLDYDDLKYAL